MDLERILEPLPESETKLSESDEALVLGGILIVGLTFITPILSIILGVPALVFVALVGIFYGTIALLLRKVLRGTFVGVIVTSVFAANVPLASTEYYNSITGALGPNLLLIHLPLLLLVLLVFAAGPRKVAAEGTLAEVLFAAFVGWSVLAALLGATARVDVALYFTLLMAQQLLVIVLFRYAVHQGILLFQTVVQLFVGAVFAQSLFALAQFINGGTFGLSTLGESGGKPISTFSLGPFGTLSAGTYVSGFTSGQFILASLIVLTVPILLAVSIEVKKWFRVVSLAGALMMIATLRGTGGDAARGGLIVGVVALVAFIGCHYRTILKRSARHILSEGASAVSTRRRWDSLFAAGASAFLSVLIIYPSSDSGGSSVVTTIGGREEPTTPQTSSARPNTTTKTAETTSSQARPVNSQLRDLSIPYFDLKNLGTRIQQYVGGIDLFVQHPLFGVGGGNFRYYALEYGLSKPLPLHNIYIALLAETGLPGFLFYTGTLALTALYGWRGLARSSNDKLLFAGVLCGIVGYLSFGFFDILQLIKPVSVFPFGVLLGGVLGKYKKTTRS